MPTYEYECTSCGQHMEAYQRFTEEALTTCAACGGRLRKVFHPAGIVFKGSGFYATDSRSASKPAGKKDGEAGATKTESAAAPASDGSSSGADAKPKAKAPAKPSSKDPAT